MLSNVTQWDAWLQVDKGRDVLLSAYPIFHIAGLFTATVGLAFGLAQILIPNPRDTRHICREINRYQPTFLANVPSLYLMLAQEPAFARCNLSRLRYCISGAAPFPAESIRQFESIVGEGKVIEVYGMTETCVIVTATPRSGKKKIGSVGLPVPSTYIRIVDLLFGKEDVPLGEEGEIIASGPQVMKGYHDKPHETDQALRQHDGRIWMHTGDIGRMDEEGYLTIVDRAKDMVSVGGFKVFPREIEEKLYALPFIEVCAALGISNPERPETEVVKLIVQPKEAYPQTPEHELRNEIISFAKEHFAPFKVPKLIEFGEIPLTLAGKVDKKELRSR
jgi:acyl-CoA synthetase (AMP-forming)/AMP-acid ligase II